MLKNLNIIYKKNDSKYSPQLDLVSVKYDDINKDNQINDANRNRVYKFIRLTKQNYDHVSSYSAIFACWFVFGLLGGCILTIVAGITGINEFLEYGFIFGVAIPLPLNLIVIPFSTKYHVVLGADLERWPPLRMYSDEKLERKIQKYKLFVSA